MTLEEIIKQVSYLPTFMHEDDMGCYFKYANQFNNGIIVDLGTGWGKSMLSLALSNETNQVISCDSGSYPVYQGWASDKKDYQNKIQELIAKNNLVGKVQFFLEDAELVLDRVIDSIDLFHIDNWLEINQTDSSSLLESWIDKVKLGGYLLMRNYGHGDRQPYTDSVDKATKGLTKIETMGLVTVFQK